jgi:hypothetical protein
MDFTLSTALYVSLTDLYPLWQIKKNISFKFKLVQMEIWLEMGSVMMKQTTQNAILMVGIAADSAL